MASAAWFSATDVASTYSRGPAARWPATSPTLPGSAGMYCPLASSPTASWSCGIPSTAVRPSHCCNAGCAHAGTCGHARHRPDDDMYRRWNRRRDHRREGRAPLPGSGERYANGTPDAALLPPAATLWMGRASRLRPSPPSSGRSTYRRLRTVLSALRWSSTTTAGSRPYCTERYGTRTECRSRAPASTCGRTRPPGSTPYSSPASNRRRTCAACTAPTGRGATRSARSGRYRIRFPPTGRSASCWPAPDAIRGGRRTSTPRCRPPASDH
jgi:hypothetical protein